jgi:hypothetical protein
MSLSDLASLGSFVSGLAVLISLIYLAIQVQQAEQNQKAQIQQGRAARLVDLQLRLADPANAEIYVRGMSGEAFEAATDLQRFRGLILASLYSMEDTFLQHKAGLLDDDHFAGFRQRVAALFASIGFRAIWRDVRMFHGCEFREFFDELANASRDQLAASASARWRESLAAERSATV